MIKPDKFYFKWVLTFVTTYIIIQLINNFEYFEGMFSSFIKMLSPFLLGLLIAYLLFPIVKFLEKQFKIKRLLSLFIVYGTIILIFVGLILWVAPIIIQSLVDLVSNIPSGIKQLDEWIRNIHLNVDEATAQSIIDKIVNFLPKLNDLLVWIINNFLNTTISLTTFLVNFVFSMIISVYILANKERFSSYCKRILYIALKKKKSDMIVDICETIHKNIGTYMIAKLIDSFFVGVVSYIGLNLLGSEYSLLLGMFCGVTNLIPYFGPFLGMVPVVVINLFFSPVTALTSTIFLLILQQIEGNIIEPKFVGGQLGLNPLLTLLAVTLGGGFFGIAGMVLSVPIMGVIKIYVDKLLNHYSYRENQ